MDSNKISLNNKSISTFKVAATYIGTVVGAGFASGQETLQFFAVFGVRGLLGLLLVTALFIFFGYIIMMMGKEFGAESHIEIIRHSGGRYLSPLIDWLITFFLFGALTAMIAGSGALVNQQFGLSPVWGNVLMAVFTVVTVLTGIKGVINSISAVVPFLLTSAVGISIISVVFIPPTAGNTIQVSESTSVLITNWLWAAILYISYNMVLSISVLGPLGVQARDKKTIRNGAILGGIGLGAAAIAIYFAIEKNFDAVQGMEIPMIFIARRIAYVLQIIYSLVLIAEIYTTAVSSLYGFTVRVCDMDSKKARYYIIGTAVLALVASQFGFSNLVRYLYPVVGYGGIVMLAVLLLAWFKAMRRPVKA